MALAASCRPAATSTRPRSPSIWSTSPPSAAASSSAASARSHSPAASNACACSRRRAGSFGRRATSSASAASITSSPACAWESRAPSSSVPPSTTAEAPAPMRCTSPMWRAGECLRAPRPAKRKMRSALGVLRRVATVPEVLEHARQDRHEDDAEDDQREVIADGGDVAEGPAGEEAHRHPEDRPDDGVRREAPVRHAADARHEGRERAHDRHEARNDDRLAAVLLVEGVRPVEVLALQEPPALLLEDTRAHVLADGVVDGVAEDGGDREEHEEDAEIERADAGERARGEEERVAREDRRHHEARLAEDDDEEEQVRPRAVLLDHLLEVGVQVQEEVEELLDQVHRGAPSTCFGGRARGGGGPRLIA